MRPVEYYSPIKALYWLKKNYQILLNIIIIPV